MTGITVKCATSSRHFLYCIRSFHVRLLYLFLWLWPCIFYRKRFIVASTKLRTNKTQVKSDFQIHFRKETRSALATGIIIFFFFVFWTPFMLTGPLKYMDIPANLSEVIKNFGMTISMSNSAINPFMYCWLRKDFRYSFRRLLCSYRLKRASIRKFRDGTEQENTTDISTHM